jgi:hypothetical protein
MNKSQRKGRRARCSVLLLFVAACTVTMGTLTWMQFRAQSSPHTPDNTALPEAKHNVESSNDQRPATDSSSRIGAEHEQDTAKLSLCGKIDKQLHREDLRARALATDGHAGLSAPPRPLVEPHLFVVWHDAMPKLEMILQDVEKQFPTVLAIGEFVWGDEGPDSDGQKTRVPAEELKDRFLMNLWRLYSGKGGWYKTGMKVKVKQCGRGPFVAVVVLDATPVYATEKTAHGSDVVNTKMNKNKMKYRRIAGGGFRVHGTFNPQEALHDITLLFHKTPSQMLREHRAAHCRSDGREDNTMPGLISQFLQNREAFRTANDTLGYMPPPHEQEWPCEDLQAALSTVADVAFYAQDIALEPKKGLGDSRIEPLQWRDCGVSWPMRLVMRVPASSVWAAVSILNPVSVDAEATDHTPPGVFEVIIAKQRRIVRLRLTS